MFHKKKIHQWRALSHCHEKEAIAGYLVYFYSINTISWVSVASINFAYNNGHKKITPESQFVSSQPDNEAINLKKLVLKKTLCYKL